MAPRAPALLVVWMTLLVSCGPDNSGGRPPAGAAVAFSVRAGAPQCGQFKDQPFLLNTPGGVTAAAQQCHPTGTPPPLAAAWQTMSSDVQAQTDSESTLLIVATIGGCSRTVAVRGLFLEEGKLHVWLLRTNTALGKPNAACTDDIGEQVLVLRTTTRIATGTAVDLVDSVVNPEAPNVPEDVRRLLGL